MPLLARELEEGDRERAERFAANAFSWMLLVLGVGTLVAIPLMRWLIALLTFGFLIPEGWSFSWEWVWEMVKYPHGTEKFEVTVAYGRIMFSYLLCMALADRLLVIFRGRIVAELDPQVVTNADVGLYMAGATP